MPKKAAIIMVNYKDYARRFLPECRDSLRAQNYPQSDYRVYIVDNASSDESRQYLNECYPEAAVIARADGNYAAANNAGIKAGLADVCEYFVIANMDTYFEKNWLSELANAVAGEPNIGLAQSKILLYPKNEAEWRLPKINSLGNIINYLGFGFTGNYQEDDREISGLPLIYGYASGCSFIITKQVLEKIGGYNEEYFMYHDDTEMSWKARLAGYKIVLAPRSVVYHKYEFSRSVRMLYYMERNRYITVFTFYRLPSLLIIFPALLIMELGMLIFFIFRGDFAVRLKIYGYFLKPESWRKIRRSRRQIKKLRAVSEREAVKNFSGKIMFQEIMNPLLKYIANPLFNFYWQVVKRIIIW